MMGEVKPVRHVSEKRDLEGRGCLRRVCKLVTCVSFVANTDSENESSNFALWMNMFSNDRFDKETGRNRLLRLASLRSCWPSCPCGGSG